MSVFSEKEDFWLAERAKPYIDKEDYQGLAHAFNLAFKGHIKPDTLRQHLTEDLKMVKSITHAFTKEQEDWLRFAHRHGIDYRTARKDFNARFDTNLTVVSFWGLWCKFESESNDADSFQTSTEQEKKSVPGQETYGKVWNLAREIVKTYLDSDDKTVLSFLEQEPDKAAEQLQEWKARCQAVAVGDVVESSKGRFTVAFVSPDGLLTGIGTDNQGHPMPFVNESRNAWKRTGNHSAEMAKAFSLAVSA